MENKKYWGEIPKTAEETIPTVDKHIERAMNKFCLSEFEVKNDEDDILHIILEPMDPTMLHAIKLHKYYNDLMDKVHIAGSTMEPVSNSSTISVPTVPEMPEIPKKHSKNSLNFIPKEFTPFTLGYDVEIPEISEPVIKQVMSKCVATMLAHAGFETTHQSVLNFMTDVLEAFFKKITHKLKVAQEDENKGDLLEFPNIIEKVLVDIGMNGVVGLHDYYQSRILKYAYVLQKRCQDLADYYQVLLTPYSPPTTSSQKMIPIKVKEEEMEIENSAILHVLNAESELGFANLETGYQLLNSLEENLQNTVG